MDQPKSIATSHMDPMETIDGQPMKPNEHLNRDHEVPDVENMSLG